ncbi:hypothetical protein BDW74DRAFT_182573 [Aspergillus multicolor]|uniref:uncharacterized protein n=1 Tax=Aspergillus multicolor TaxID=41759 RepID=UPI003CCD781E
MAEDHTTAPLDDAPPPPPYDDILEPSQPYNQQITNPRVYNTFPYETDAWVSRSRSPSPPCSVSYRWLQDYRVWVGLFFIVGVALLVCLPSGYGGPDIPGV